MDILKGKVFLLLKRRNSGVRLYHSVQNHPTKPIWLICIDGLTSITFPGQARRLTSNQMDSQLSVEALPGGTSSPSISLGPNGRGPWF